MAWVDPLRVKPPLKDRWPSSQDWAVQAVAAALCFFGGEIGLLFSREHVVAAPIWPPAGLALACTLLFGYRVWPGLLAGSFLLKVIVLTGARLNPIAVVSSAMCMSSGETLQALVGAWLADTYARGRNAMHQPCTVALFFGFSAIVSPVLSATSNSFAAVLAGFLPWGDLGDLWGSTWLSNMLGVFLLAPLLLVWSYERIPKLSPQRIAEAVGVFLLLLAGCVIAFGPFHVANFRGVAFSCMLIPMLLWTAFRFGERGTVSATFIFGCLALIGTLNGHGPFVVGDIHTSFLLAQNFIAALTVMALLLSAEVKQRQRIDEGLRASDQRLRLALAASRMGIWTVELQGQPRIISSPELDAIFGLKPGEFDGTEKTLFTFIHPDDHVMIRTTLAQAIKTEGEYEIEFRILPRDRPIGWLLARGCSCFDARGQPSRLIGVAFDITGRKAAEDQVLQLNLELERRVAERTAALEAINKELESFSYSVSHDLRAPLRSIRGFSEVLLDRYGSKLDDRGREFLRRACESSNQMDLLIDDLLKLSRIGRAELHQQPVDLTALARSIAAELLAAEPKRAVKFSIGRGLQACGDQRLLRIALENLLRNAWKFTANQPKARIEFGQTPGPQPAFFVRDNGAGFDMAYASRLFGVFQRLHSSSEFPGSGIGLATVQRILNRHGGRAWAESAVDQGATFYFSLPGTRVINGSANFAEKENGVIVQEQVTA